MDIKRVAFETKPVNRPLKNDPVSFDHLEMPRGSVRRTVKREEIASIVDKFLSSRIGNTKPESTTAKSVLAEAEPSPVKTIIHELRPQSLTENGSEKTPVDFVSENDVRAAMEKGEKIFIHAKTILTPSARDLGEEKEIFART